MLDPRELALNRFRQPRPLAPPPSDPPSTLSMVVSSILILGVGIAYLGGSIKRGPQGGFHIGKGRLSGGRASLHVSPSRSGLAIKF